MKIIVLGAKGNFGSYISNYLCNYHEIIPLSKKDLDIREKDYVLNMFQKFSPDAVVHAAGLSNIDFCETHEADSYTINTLGTLNVAYACNKLDIPIIYISSSLVYSGEKNSPYFETDKCEPINVYGKSKLAGEKLIRTICKKYFIIRTSWCYGGQNCYVKKILENINSKLFISSLDVVNPTSMEDICSCILKILSSDFYGVYNCCSNDYASKESVVRFIFDYINLKKDVLPLSEEESKNYAPRPKNTSMNTSLIRNCFKIDMPSWKDSLTKYLNEIILQQ